MLNDRSIDLQAAVKGLQVYHRAWPIWRTHLPVHLVVRGSGRIIQVAHLLSVIKIKLDLRAERMMPLCHHIHICQCPAANNRVG